MEYVGRRRAYGNWIVLAAAISSAAMLAATLPPGASASSNDLGPIGLGTVVVDDARSHVLVSGPAANVIEVLDFSGALVATIPDIHGAWGMVVSGHYLYAAESTAGAIVRIDLDSPSLSATPLAAGLLEPRWLVMTGGKLWTTVATLPCCGWGTLASIDPKSGRTKVFSQNYYSPDLAVSPGAPGTLFLAEDGLSPGAVFRIDVSPAKLRVVASNSPSKSSARPPFCRMASAIRVSRIPRPSPCRRAGPGCSLPGLTVATAALTSPSTGSANRRRSSPRRR